MKFHSWAPLYFNYDAIESMSADLSYDTASPGLIGMFQNDLGSAWGTVGYSVHPDDDGVWRHSGHMQFTYTGLYPVLEASFHLYDSGAAQYHFERRAYAEKVSYASAYREVDGPAWMGSLKAYIPFHYNSGGIQRGWVPQVSWSLSNNLYDNGTMELDAHENLMGGAPILAFKSFTHGQNLLMQSLHGSVRGYWMLPKAESQVYPRWGVGVETGFSGRPGLEKIFSPVWYNYLYGYLPGLTRTQGFRLSASTQYQLPTGAPFGENGINMAPRGFTSADTRAIARKNAFQVKLSADYAIPIYVGDISWFSPVAYISHFLLIPHVDWLGFGVARNGIGTAEKSSLLSAGADLTAELGNFFWAPFPCSLGVSASWLGGPYFKTLSENAEEGRKPFSIGLIFSMDI